MKLNRGNLKSCHQEVLLLNHKAHRPRSLLYFSYSNIHQDVFKLLYQGLDDPDNYYFSYLKRLKSISIFFLKGIYRSISKNSGLWYLSPCASTDTYVYTGADTGFCSGGKLGRETPVIIFPPPELPKGGTGGGQILGQPWFFCNIKFKIGYF